MAQGRDSIFADPNIITATGLRCAGSKSQTSQDKQTGKQSLYQHGTRNNQWQSLRTKTKLSW
jgi:hypothetical protein